MKSPITGKKMKKMRRISQISYKGKMLWVSMGFYQCADTLEEFTTDEIDEKNIESIEKAYAEKGRYQ